MNDMNPTVLSGQTSYFVTFLASFLIVFQFGGLLILWLVDGRVKKEQALHALLAALVAWAITQMIKGLFPTIRPFELYGTLPMTLTVPIDASFPSGHAAASFALAVSLWFHNKKLGTFFLILALLIGLGRIWGNVHYFVDILAGAVLGTAVSYIVERLHLYKLIK